MLIRNNMFELYNAYAWVLYKMCAHACVDVCSFGHMNSSMISLWHCGEVKEQLSVMVLIANHVWDNLIFVHS